jgi:hypothetical protein
VRLVLLLVVLVALLSACAGEAASGGASPSGSSSSPAAAPDNHLVIDVNQGGGIPPRRWNLTCGAPAGGTHPDAQAACDHLAGMADPFAPLPPDVMCNQIYGGPQTAHVTGRWKGAAVDVRLSRVDGCRTGQWNSLGPLLPGPVGVSPPS